jgi:photosystem II stability/assembly factor-like uncharacterized protein
MLPFDQLVFPRKALGTALVLSSCGINLFLFLLVTCLPTSGQTRATGSDHGPDIATYPTSAHQVDDLFFLDPKHGWIMVTDHILNQDHLFRTVDGGVTWKNTVLPLRVGRLFFLNAATGWALQYSFTAGEPAILTYHLLGTKDGGKNWRQISSRPFLSGSSDNTPVLVDFAFSDEKHGWVVGGAPYNVGWVLQTSTGGKSFEKLAQISAFFQACFGVVASVREVWIYGEGGFLHSQDSGKTWSPISLGEFTGNRELVTFRSGVLARDGSGWLAGNLTQAIVIGTKNFGQDWQVRLRSDNPRQFDLISSWDWDHACAAAAPLLFCTADGGATWNKRATWPETEHDRANLLERLVILPSGKGWAVRGGGYLYQTDDGGQSWYETDPMKQLADSRGAAGLRAD